MTVHTLILAGTHTTDGIEATMAGQAEVDTEAPAFLGQDIIPGEDLCVPQEQVSG